MFWGHTGGNTNLRAMVKALLGAYMLGVHFCPPPHAVHLSHTDQATPTPHHLLQEALHTPPKGADLQTCPFPRRASACRDHPRSPHAGCTRGQPSPDQDSQDLYVPSRGYLGSRQAVPHPRAAGLPELPAYHTFLRWAQGAGVVQRVGPAINP